MFDGTVQLCVIMTPPPFKPQKKHFCNCNFVIFQIEEKLHKLLKKEKKKKIIFYGNFLLIFRFSLRYDWQATNIRKIADVRKGRVKYKSLNQKALKNADFFIFSEILTFRGRNVS